MTGRSKLKGATLSWLVKQLQLRLAFIVTCIPPNYVRISPKLFSTLKLLLETVKKSIQNSESNIMGLGSDTIAIHVQYLQP